MFESRRRLFSSLLLGSSVLLGWVACGGEDGTLDGTEGTDATGETTGETTSETGDTGDGDTTSGDGDGDTSSGDGDGTSGDGDGDGDGDGSAALCFADDFVNGPLPDGPDYDQFGPVIGSHCFGTDHQDITGVERVVFLGDSVTVGTPPWANQDVYRSKLADTLEARFGLQFGTGLLQDEWSWKQYDPFSGTSIARDSGDFSNCSKWGARTDDFLMGGNQFQECFPPATRDLKTLVIITIGGNDLSSLTQDAIAGATMAELWASTMQFVDYQREALEWLTDPAVFPNGTFVLTANFYEFTDATGDVAACDVSALAGFGDPIPAPDELKEMVVWANEQILSMAVDTGTDMIFMLEEFCGHGFNADDPTGPCYRGPGQDVWFDLTCIHPNSIGHDRITEMFTAVVDE